MSVCAFKVDTDQNFQNVGIHSFRFFRRRIGILGGPDAEDRKFKYNLHSFGILFG